MSQRWLGTVLLNAEAGFRCVKGAKHIPTVIKAIEAMQTTTVDNGTKMAA